MYRSDSNALITSWLYFNNAVNFARCHDFLPPFDWLVQKKIGKKLNTFNSENRFKNRPKAKIANKFRNRKKSLTVYRQFS